MPMVSASGSTAKASTAIRSAGICMASSPDAAPRYAELQVTSNYSFLRGAAHPDELVLQAKALGHHAIGLTDRNSLAGMVRAHVAAKEAGMTLRVGVRLDFQDHPSLLCYPTDRAAYGLLCQLLSIGKLRAPKGECHLGIADLYSNAAGQILIAVPPDQADDGFTRQLITLAHDLPGQIHLGAACAYDGADAIRLAQLAGIARAARIRLVATNDVHYHVAERRMLQDVVTCIREGCTIATAGGHLHPNAERHLKPPEEMARLFRLYPDALVAGIEIVEACHFSMDDLSYDYPDESGGDPRTPQQRLTDLTWEGAKERYPDGVPTSITETITHELALIEQLGYAPYFLTVHHIVQFARSKGILAQGRGSAANSVVCYCLGVTSVNPIEIDLLFERFVSAERNEPPDIDVDFEHERREEVIQYIYDWYGRDHAAITATVSCFRARGAVREVGKAMGLSADTVAKLAETAWGWSAEAISDDRAREIGLDPSVRMLRLTLDLARALIGFPRHLSQHVGGFVLTRSPLDTVVPISNAAMKDRTVIEWDKDDLDALRILKIDVLALGMLTCVRKAFDLLARHHGKAYTLATIPGDDRPTYDMLCRADSIGVFQVESRAQMSMLPRLRPKKFYDLVIEVAIVRPGPIQGGMVHPYLRRRSGEEPVDYPSEALREVLGKTCGVPLFQEQAMRIAIVAAGFTPAEADQLRRAMATFRKLGIIHRFRDKFINGMIERDYAPDFAERCFAQIEGFGSYGFPESHAASFALLVYVSAWLKCHYPAAFTAALLNSLPMGFYAPAQLIGDARAHGVRVLASDINHSDWDSTLEPDPESPRGVALRLGLRLIKGVREEAATKLMKARAEGGPFASPRDLWRRGALPPATLAILAHADCFRSLGLDRRQAGWLVKGLGDVPLTLFAGLPSATEEIIETAVTLPDMGLGGQVAADYAAQGLSLKRHPMAFFRRRVAAEGIIPTQGLLATPAGRRVAVAGLVLVRQRPGTASGIIFITVEDETGIANLIVRPPIFARHRQIVLTATLLAARGRVEREGDVIHILVEELFDRSTLLDSLSTAPAALQSGIRRAISRADEVLHPPIDPADRGRARFPKMSRDFH
jgi:error-prone DNA polymerase